MDDELPKVSPSLLRDTGSGCPRRLALEHAGQRGTRRSDARFQVTNVLEDHARLAQLERALPNVDTFVGDPGFTVEQRAVYDHAVRWYLTLYGGHEARALDLGDDEWSRDRPDLGVRLTSRRPLVFETTDAVELRILRLNAAPPPPDLLDDIEVRIDVLRLVDRTDGRPVRSCVSDLVRGEHADATVDPEVVAPGLDRWLTSTLDDLRATADRERPRIGPDCGWCAFVTRCPEHKPHVS